MSFTSFVYKWTDSLFAKYYIGAHKGSPDDGYICSSKLMKKEYTKRPQDFTREILSFHESFQLATEEEQRLLTEVDAKNNPLYYNQHNGNGNFILKKHSQETLELYRKQRKGKPSKRKGIPLSEETKRKLSESRKGQVSTFKGHHHSEEAKHKLSEAHKGKVGWSKGLTFPPDHPLRKPKSLTHRENIRQATLKHSLNVRPKHKRIHTPFGIFDSMKEASEQLSQYTYNQIDNMVRKRNDKYPDWYTIEKY